jgi:hypothetical protein
VRIASGELGFYPLRAYTAIDAHHTHLYSGIGGNAMAVRLVQMGQVWRKDDNGQDYLVTKVYNEVFSQYAVLRPAEVTAPDAPTVKVKVAKAASGVALPGFTFTQDGSF